MNEQELLERLAEQKPDTRSEQEKMAEVNAILRMWAGRWNCKVSDLQWKRDAGGHIHIRRKPKEKLCPVEANVAREKANVEVNENDVGTESENDIEGIS